MSNLDELREKLESLYNESRTMGMLRTGNPMAHMIDGAMELIQQETLKARIDERDKIDYELEVLQDLIDEDDAFTDEFRHGARVARKEVSENTKDRIAELEAQLTPNNKKG